MDPVFRGISDKVLLTSTGRGIAFDRASTGAHKIVLFGEFHYEGVIVFSVEWFGVETGCKDRFKNKSGLFLH